MTWIKVKSIGGIFVYINASHIVTFFYDSVEDNTLIFVDSEDLWKDKNVAVKGDITKELATAIGRAANCSVFHITGEK